MAFLYPWGNTQQLNLDWILKKIKELETGGGAGADLEEVANALITLTHRSTTQYQRRDYCFYNGKLYRALVNTTGAFAPGDWREVVLGDDVSDLTRLINALDTDNIDNASNVTGNTASDALDNLNSALNKFIVGTEIPANSDLDTYLTPGNYFCTGVNSSSVSHTATSGFFLLKVENYSSTVDGNRSKQYFMNTTDVYIRHRDGAGWKAWKQFAFTENFVRVTGTISSSTLYVSDSKVTTDMIPVSCEFGTPDNVATDYKINTNTAGRITFTNITLNGSTTVDVILMKILS